MAVARTERQRVDRVVDGQVAGNGQDVQELAVIPNGELWRITRFGGSEVGTGDGKASVVALQLFDGTAWQTIRGFGIVSTGVEVELARDVRGDGTKKLRVVRQNKSASAKQIIAWVEGFKVA
jgi:hypothetical protein